MKFLLKKFLRGIGLIAVKKLMFWQLVFRGQRFLVIDLLVIAGVLLSGYFGLRIGFDTPLALILVAVTLLLVIFRWLLIISIPLRTPPLPFRNQEKLAELVEPEFDNLLKKVKEIETKVDRFFKLSIWEIEDYGEAKQLEIYEAKEQWMEVLAGLTQLDGLRKQFARFGEIGYKKESDLFTKAFLIADTALIGLMYNSLRIINATNHHGFMEVLLDDNDQQLRLLGGNYTRLVQNAVHLNEFVRINLGVLFLQYIRRKKYIDVPQQNYDQIMTYLREVNDLLAEYGWENFSQILLRMFKRETYKLWFPLQKNVAEAMGNIRLPMRDYNLISIEQVQEMREKLEPGDVLVARSSWFLSNAGLPGFWPHAIFYLGDADQFLDYFENDIDVQEFLQAKYREAGLESVLENKFAAAWRQWQQPDAWGNPRSVVEAISEGVVIRSLEVVALVDYVAAIRPNLTKVQKIQAILYALASFGKPYDFEFDFRIDSASGCTELVYKSYSRVTDMPLKPVRVAGQLTMPANELIKSFARDREFWKFVYFIDGNPKLGTAKIKNAKQLSKSWKRSKWDFVHEGLFKG